MAWLHQATHHYLNKYSLISTLPFGLIRHQWVNKHSPEKSHGISLAISNDATWSKKCRKLSKLVCYCSQHCACSSTSFRVQCSWFYNSGIYFELVCHSYCWSYSHGLQNCVMYYFHIIVFIFGTACQIYCYGRYCVRRSVSPQVPENPSGPLVDNFIVLPCVAFGVTCVKLLPGVDLWNSLDEPRVIGPCHCEVWGWPRH